MLTIGTTHCEATNNPAVPTAANQEGLAACLELPLAGQNVPDQTRRQPMSSTGRTPGGRNQRSLQETLRTPRLHQHLQVDSSAHLPGTLDIERLRQMPDNLQTEPRASNDHRNRIRTKSGNDCRIEERSG